MLRFDKNVLLYSKVFSCMLKRDGGLFCQVHIEQTAGFFPKTVDVCQTLQATVFLNKVISRYFENAVNADIITHLMV